MPRKSVKKDPDKFRIKPEADAEQIKKTRRKSAISVFKSRQVGSMVQYLIDNDDSGKSREELVEKFREDCAHVFQEIAHLSTDSNRISFQICKVCGIMVSGPGKPSVKNRLGNGKAD